MLGLAMRWMLLAFGVAYFSMGWTGRPNRGVIARYWESCTTTRSVDPIFGIKAISHAQLDPARRSDPGADVLWAAFKRLVVTGGRDEVAAAVRRAVPASRVRARAARHCCQG